jgi:hypothetical protein
MGPPGSTMFTCKSFIGTDASILNDYDPEITLDIIVGSVRHFNQSVRVSHNLLGHKIPMNGIIKLANASTKLYSYEDDVRLFERLDYKVVNSSAASNIIQKGQIVSLGMHDVKLQRDYAWIDWCLLKFYLDSTNIDRWGVTSLANTYNVPLENILLSKKCPCVGVRYNYNKTRATLEIDETEGCSTTNRGVEIANMGSHPWLTEQIYDWMRDSYYKRNIDFVSDVEHDTLKLRYMGVFQTDKSRIRVIRGQVHAIPGPSHVSQWGNAPSIFVRKGTIEAQTDPVNKAHYQVLSEWASAIFVGKSAVGPPPSFDADDALYYRVRLSDVCAMLSLPEQLGKQLFIGPIPNLKPIINSASKLYAFSVVAATSETICDVKEFAFAEEKCFGFFLDSDNVWKLLMLNNNWGSSGGCLSNKTSLNEFLQPWKNMLQNSANKHPRRGGNEGSMFSYDPQADYKVYVIHQVARCGYFDNVDGVCNPLEVGQALKSNHPNIWGPIIHSNQTTTTCRSGPGGPDDGPDDGPGGPVGPNDGPNDGPDDGPNDGPNDGPGGPVGPNDGGPRTKKNDHTPSSSETTSDDGLSPILLGIPFLAGLLALLFFFLVIMKRKK